MLKILSKFQYMDDDVDIASDPVALTYQSKKYFNTDSLNHANHHASQQKRKAKTLSLKKGKTQNRRVNRPCDACLFIQKKTSLDINNTLLLSSTGNMNHT